MSLFVGDVGYAQASTAADSSKWRPYQVGFSSSAFVTILEGPDAPEDYQIYGRYRVTRHWTARSALRYEYLRTEDQKLEIAARLGVDYVLRDGNRLQLYAGMDAVGIFDQFLNNDRTVRVGAAPLFGMLIFVTDYLSLSVEPRLVALYSYFDNPTPSPDVKEWSVELKGNNLLIISLHF